MENKHLQNKYLQTVQEAFEAMRSREVRIMDMNKSTHPIVAQNAGVSISMIDSLAMYLADRFKDNLPENEFNWEEFLRGCRGY